jgi:Zn-dependent M28 family amino/carboxypeptidase
LLDAFKNSPRHLPKVLTLPIPFKGLFTPDTLRSDHAAFWYQGVGAVLVSDTANLRTPHYHQPSDKPNTIVRSFFTGSAQIIVNAVTNLIKRNDILTTQTPKSIFN